jgi:hypothetical protein
VAVKCANLQQSLTGGFSSEIVIPQLEAPMRLLPTGRPIQLLLYNEKR